MTTPINIVDAICTALAQITTANGYALNLSSERIQFGRATAATVPLMPSVWVSPGTWSEDQEGDGADLSPNMGQTLEVSIECFNQSASQSPRHVWEAGVVVADAVRTALLADRSLGGLCFDLKVNTHFLAGGEFTASNRSGVAEVKLTAHWVRGNA